MSLMTKRASFCIMVVRGYIFMKVKSLLGFLFVLPLIACNKSNAPKEITKEQALERTANNSVGGVVVNCGRYAVEEYKVSFTEKYGMFKNFTDEQLYRNLTGKDTIDIEGEDANWLVLTASEVNSYDEEITWFYASGKNGVKTKFVYTIEHYEFYINITDTDYYFDVAVNEIYTYGDYGQLIKYKSSEKFMLIPELYPNIPDSGFTMHWNESYTYSDKIK